MKQKFKQADYFILFWVNDSVLTGIEVLYAEGQGSSHSQEDYNPIYKREFV